MEKISQKKQEKPLIKSEKGINDQEVLKKIYDFLEKEKRDSVFEFIIDGLTIVNNNYKEYFENKSKCPNCETKILIQGTNKYLTENIASYNFKLEQDNLFGIGIYLFEQLDFVTYYCNNKTFGNIPKIGQTFPIVGAEVYYDSMKFKHIYDYSYLKVFDSLPTEKDIQENTDKTVEKNGIHYIVVDGYELNLFNKNKKIVSPILNSENTPAPPPTPFPLNRYLGKEYVVTDKSQILPLFSFTMKRVEYCIIWRDTNFLEDKKYFENCKKYKNVLKNLNLYIETTTESALKLVWKKKYNKIILITNVGRNLEGKTYIDKVRKILGFNVVAFFFASSSRHLEWIKNYPNCLYANNEKFVNKFIELFNNEEGNKEENLNNLKKEIEKNFNTKLQDFYEPMKYPLYKDGMSAIDHYGILDCSPYENQINLE